MPKKRVLYPWVQKKKSRTCKAFIAVVGDNIDWSDILVEKMSKKKFFETHIMPKILIAFPTMYSSVKRYYEENGRSLTKDEFKVVLYGRFHNLFDVDHERNKITKTQEHPKNTRNKQMKIAYIKAKRMFVRGLVWGSKHAESE